MLANTSLVLTFFVYLALLKMGSEKGPGGDYGVGHSLVLFLLGAALFLTSLMATIGLASNGGLGWAPGQGGAQKLLLGLGWVVFFASTLVVTGYHNPENSPFWIKVILKSGGRYWWPLLTLLPAFLLANPGFLAGKNAGGSQLAMKAAFCLNALFCLGMYVQIQVNKSAHRAAAIASEGTDPDWEERNRVSWIKDSTAVKLWYSSHSKKSGVARQAFIEATSGENWTGELLRVVNLEHDHWELYAFMKNYSTDLPAGIDAALEKSIRRLAGQIRAQDPNEGFQKSQETDGLNIRQLTGALNQWFSDSEVDFRPAMRELQESMAAAPPEVLKEEREAVEAWLRAKG